MTGAWCPQARGDGTVVDLDGDLVILDPEGRLHVLNETASAVWCHCDGENTVDDVVTALAGAYGVPPESISSAVAILLEQLRGRDLVT